MERTYAALKSISIYYYSTTTITKNKNTERKDAVYVFQNFYYCWLIYTIVCFPSILCNKSIC